MAEDKLFVGWHFDERSGSVLGAQDTDGDDLVIFKARCDSRGHTYSVLSRSEERRALQMAAAAPDLYEALQDAESTMFVLGEHLVAHGNPALLALVKSSLPIARGALAKANPAAPPHRKNTED